MVHSFPGLMLIFKDLAQSERVNGRQQLKDKEVSPLYGLR